MCLTQKVEVCYKNLVVKAQAAWKAKSSFGKHKAKELVSVGFVSMLAIYRLNLDKILSRFTN